MKPVKNVVFVDFRKGRGPSLRGVSGESRLALVVFLALLTAEVLGAAVFFPSAIGSGFFGPTVLALAVAGAMGARRAVDSARVARSRRRLRESGGTPVSGDRAGRTLH